MRESEIESWSKNLAKKSGWWVRKFKSPANNAVPDDVFAKAGRRGFYVEFKATGVKPSELQLNEHTDMRRAGLTVYVCDGREQFRTILDYEEQQRA